MGFYWFIGFLEIENLIFKTRHETDRLEVLRFLKASFLESA
jgi:hypothetical protein